MTETDPIQALKTKYNLDDAAIAEIATAGLEAGVTATSPPGKARGVPLEEPEAESEEDVFQLDLDGSGFDLKKALRSGTDLDEIMRFMVIDNYIKERFGKDKPIPPEIKALLRQARTGKKEAGDLDALMDKMMKYEMIQSFIESRKARNQPQQQPQQPVVDIEKSVTNAIKEVGDKMAEALRTHKLEDERDRAEERARQAQQKAAEAEQKLKDKEQQEAEEKKLAARVQASVEPLEKELRERIQVIQARLQNVTPEERKKYMLDLNELVTETVGEELKDRIVTSIQSAFSKEESPPITTTVDGKPQIDWFKLGERALRTLDNFINKLPTQPPPKKEVKKLPQLQTEPATEPQAAPKPAAPAQKEKALITEKPQEEVQQTTAEEKAPPAKTTKRATKPAQPEKSSQQSTTTNRGQKT